MAPELMQTEAVATETPIRSTSHAQWWCCFTVMVLTVLVSGCYQMVNGDIWWHLRAGDWILDNGAVPRRNLFTYTNPDAVWIDLHWIFQVIVAGIYREFGTAGLVVWKSVVGAVALGAVFFTAFKRVSGVLFAFAWLPFVWIYAGRFHVRPEMLSHLYLGVTLLIIHSHHHGRSRVIWLLIPIQVAWVNSQGLFILQHCVLGAYALNEQFRDFSKPRLNRVWYALVACSIATLCNPYGLQGAIFPLELLQKVGGENREFFQLLAGETMGMGNFLEDYGIDGILRSNTPRLMMLTVPLCLGVVLLGSRRRLSLTIYRWILMFGFGYLAWNMNRNASLYAMVWGYVFVSTLGELIGTKSVPKSSDDPALALIRSAITKIGILFIVISLLASVTDLLGNKEMPGGHYPPRRAGFGEDGWYHHEAARFIAEMPGVENVYVHYNGTGLAGVVIYHAFRREVTSPKRVFADARLEANSPEVLRHFLEALGENNQTLARFEGVLSEYGLNKMALVFKNNDLIIRKRLLEELIASEKWRSVYLSMEPNKGEGVTIFVSQDVVEKHHLKIVSVGELRTRF